VIVDINGALKAIGFALLVLFFVMGLDGQRGAPQYTHVGIAVYQRGRSFWEYRSFFPPVPNKRPTL
jgi:hypothetical protein